MGWGFFSPVQNLVGGAVDTAKDIGGGAVSTARDITGGLAGAIEDLAGEAKNFLSTPAGQIAMAYFLPTAGGFVSEQLGLTEALKDTALAQNIGVQRVANAVGSAIASTALQTAQGVDLATAVQNAGVNATAATGSPYAANYVAEVFKNMPAGAVNALTSAGVSAGATLAKGGNAEDAFKNAIAASGASGTVALNPDISRSAAQALATYAVTGDATKAAIAAATAEAGAKPKVAPEPPPPIETQVDIPTQEATAPEIPEIKITEQRDTPEVISELPSRGEVKITAKKDAPALITDIPETPQTPSGQIQAKEDTTQPSTKEASKVGQDLFIFSGQYPKSGGLSQALSTSFQAPFYPIAGTSGLTAERGAGEIEGTETGGKRRNVWNEESLRLKDALGL
jgi:hypothetical protein